MRARQNPRKGKKPPTPMIQKPPGVAIKAFLMPFIQAMGEATPDTLSILMKRAHIPRDRAEEALNTLVIELIKRWMKSAQVPAAESWPSFLAHEAGHVLFRPPRKDQRLLTYAPFAPDPAQLGLPHPVERGLAPLDQAIQNEDVKRAFSAADRLPWRQRWAVFLWSNGLSFELIGTILGVAAGYARLLKLLGCTALRKLLGMNDSA